MQIAVEIKPQQIGRIVRRAAGVLDDGVSEPQRAHIARGDEGIEETHGIIGRDVILEPFGQEQGLMAIQSATMLHACKRQTAGVKVSNRERVFTQPRAGANADCPLSLWMI